MNKGEAKFERDKFVLERHETGLGQLTPEWKPTLEDKAEAVQKMHVDPDNFDKIIGEPTDALDLLKKKIEKCNKETWAEVKHELDLDNRIETYGIKLNDAKELWTTSRKKKNAKSKSEIVKKPVEKPKFDYDVTELDAPITTLEGLERIISKNFPSIWFETKACLATYCTLCLKNLNGCPSLNLVGNPSGEKTTVLSFFYGHEKAYLSDRFTPKAFVSNSTTIKKEDLKDIDLLPRLKNKALITPELAPLFEAAKDELLDNFATLTRILDGEGFNVDTGAHGHRGYSGDYKFVWLGATTPLRASVWNIMGKIGNRLFFLNMRDKNRSSEDYIEMFRGVSYESKVRECRAAVRSYLNHFFQKYPSRSVEWDAEQDILLLQDIVKYAQLLAKLRGTLMVWKSEAGDYEHNFPIIEEPPRAINALFNLAKGHALINGRTFLKSEDLEIVKAVAFASMPHDRLEFFKVLAKHEGRLTTKNLEVELSCSDDTARRTMQIFKILEVVDLKSLNLGSESGRPMQYVEIKPEFAELLKHTHNLIPAENDKPQELEGVAKQISAHDFIKITKNGGLSGQTQVRNNAENDKPQKITDVLGNVKELL